VSTNITVRKVHIGASNIGICIACESTQNNDLHTIDQVYITGEGAVGIRIGNHDSKWNLIHRGTIAHRKVGIDNFQGSFKADGVNFSYNGTDILLGSPTTPSLFTIHKARAPAASWTIPPKAAPHGR